MTRTIILTTLALGGLVTAVAVRAQQPAGEKPKVVVEEKLKDNLYVLRGDGGGGLG